MGNFEEAVQFVLNNEGGLEESKSDPGGITKYGISLRLLKSLDQEKLRKSGFSVTPETISRLDIEQLTPAQAKAIYKEEFWDHAPFKRIHNQNVCNYLFDAVVNMGISPAVKCVQRALWSAAKQRGIVLDDGILGENTLELINQCGAFILLPAMRSERAGEYRLVVEKNPTSKEYLDGWLNRSYNQGTKS